MVGWIIIQFLIFSIFSLPGATSARGARRVRSASWRKRTSVYLPTSNTSATSAGTRTEASTSKTSTQNWSNSSPGPESANESCRTKTRGILFTSLLRGTEEWKQRYWKRSEEGTARPKVLQLQQLLLCRQLFNHKVTLLLNLRQKYVGESLGSN